VLGLTRSRNWGRSLELGAERSLPPGVRRRPSREPARAAWRCKSCCRCKLFSATRSPAIRHATRADIFLHPSSTIFLPARFLPSSPPRHVLPCYPHVAIPSLSSLLTPTLSCVITCVITGAVDTAPKVPSCVINSGTFNQSTNHLPLFIISVRRPPPHPPTHISSDHTRFVDRSWFAMLHQHQIVKDAKNDISVHAGFSRPPSRGFV